MLTAGMLMLLIMTVLSANRMISENTQAQFATQALATSASLANDLLLEIMSKRFDEKSDTSGYQATSKFSEYLQGGWGPNAGEQTACPLPDSSYIGAYKSKTIYNDIDDYDGYWRILSANGITGFNLKVVVNYVNPGTPDTKVTTRTYFKRVEVTVKQSQFLNADLGNIAVYTTLASY